MIRTLEFRYSIAGISAGSLEAKMERVESAAREAVSKVRRHAGRRHHGICTFGTIFRIGATSRDECAPAAPECSLFRDK